MTLTRIFVAASFGLLLTPSLASEPAGISVWAQSDTNHALRWSGARSRVAGQVHSNGKLVVNGARNKFQGGTSWVTGFSNSKPQGKNANVFDPPPQQVGTQAWPRPYQLTDYMPGGAAALAAGDAYVDLTSACAIGAPGDDDDHDEDDNHDDHRYCKNGVHHGHGNSGWDDDDHDDDDDDDGDDDEGHSGGTGHVSLSFAHDQLPGRLYWAPCDISVNAKKTHGPITIVSTGKVHLKVRKQSQLTSFVDGIVALSSADSGKAIHLNGNRSEIHGDLVAEYGEVHLAGSGQTLSCGVFADRVKVSGAKLRIHGESCAAPTVNMPPLAESDSAETLQDTAVEIAVLANDSDQDGVLVPASVTVVTAAANGATSVDAVTGNVTYLPAAGFAGNDVFQYTVADNDGAVSEPATVTVAVQNVNSAPTANDDAFVTAEDVSIELDVLQNDVDVDGVLDAGSVLVTEAPANGTAVVDIDTGLIAYSPDPDYFGEDILRYTVADDDGAVSAAALVVITVSPVNDAPIAQPDLVSGAEDTTIPLDLLANDTDVDDVLSGSNVVIAVPPSSGTVSVDATSGAIVYTPVANFFGSDSFEYSLVDAAGAASALTAVVSITVDPVNDAPDAGGIDVALLEDSGAAIVLAATDVEGDPVSFVIIDSPAFGVLSGTAPDLNYTPDANFFGTDSFTFVASDGIDDSAIATVAITVAPVNDLPIIVPQAFSATEDTPLDLSVMATDVDGDTLSITVTVPPANGSVTGSGVDLQYVPDPDFNGQDTFTIVASDSEGSSDPAVLTIDVAAANDAPVANAQSLTTAEDTPLALVLTGDDVDGDALTFEVQSDPANGVLSGTPPNLAYTPNADFSGEDSFTFRVADGELNSAPALVQITVTPANDVPTATPQSLTTDEDVPLAITLGGSDADNDTLTFSVVDGPANGTLTGTAPNLVYTPAADYNGNDFFSFLVNDGQSDSPVAVVSIAVAAVNDTPVADDVSVLTNEDAPVGIVLTGADVDGDALAFRVLQGPASGALSGAAPNLTYTPGADFSGTDSFTFVANDGATDSAPATASITVTAFDDPPVANAQAVVTDEDSPLAIVLSGSDPEGLALSYAITAAPQFGTLSGSAPNLTYTPNADYFGADAFSFTVNDGAQDSLPAVVSITVNAIDDAPAANAQAVATDEDTPLAVTLSGNDPEGATLSYSVTVAPQSGTLSGTAPNLTYTPNADFAGNDEFSFTVNDGAQDSAPATISITVNPVDDAPQADGQAVATDEDTPLAITLSGSDPEGATLSYNVTAAPQSGTLSGTAPNLTYTPNADFAGSDEFSFTVNDGAQDSLAAVVSITVNAVDDAPQADPQAVSTNEDTPVAITLTGSDAEGATLTFVVVAGPGSGSLAGVAPDLTYTPDADYSGPDSFTFVVNDGAQDSLAATVNITVDAVNDPPEADANAVVTAEDTPLAITLTGTDTEGAGLTFRVLAGPSSGSIDGAAPNITYTPDLNFFGADSLSFVANDGSQDSAPAVIDITVTPVNDVPSATDIAVDAIAGQAVAVSLSGQDDDSDALTFRVLTQPGNGTLSGPVTALLYTAAAGFSGTDSFTFVANDGTVDSAPATVTLQVTDNNTPPSIDSSPNTQASRLAAYAYQVLASDADGDALSYALPVAPAGMTISPTGLVEWLPDVVGQFDVTVEVSDGNGGSTQQAYVVDVADSNSPPVFDRIPLLNAPLGETYSETGSATDPDGDAIAFTLTAGPVGSTVTDFGDGTFRVDWPAAGNVGDAVPLTITATDASGASSVLNLTVVVTGDRINRSHLGTDFWGAFGINFRNTSFGLGAMPVTDPGRQLQIVIGAPDGANATIEIAGLAFTESVALLAGETATVDIPIGAMLGSPSLSDRAFHVFSDAPITVAGINWAFATTDAFLVLPTSTNGTDHVISGYRDVLFQPSNNDIFWAVVASEDNTTVTVTRLSQVPDRINANADTVQVTLNRGQVQSGFMTYADSATVVADQPVAVFGGSSCANIPFTVGTCDHLWQQFVPADTLASEYIVAPMATRTASLYRVIASEDDTRVSINGVYSALLSRGEAFESILPGPLSITGSRPITAIQYAAGNGLDTDVRMDDRADPFMLNLAPVDTFLADYTVVVPSGDGVFRDQPGNIVRPPIDNHYLSFVIPSSVADGLFLDGGLVDTATFEAVPGTDFLAGNVEVLPGTHQASANEQFGVTVYGFGLEESYGYYAGLILPDGNAGLQVDLQGPAAALVAGSDEACLDITVRDLGGALVPRARFTIDIAGTVPITFTGFTNRLGTAQYCYTQPTAGTDTVNVDVAGDNAVVGVDWLPNSDPGTNGAPAITSYPELEVFEATFVYPITTIDPDGDTVTLSVSDGPNGVAIVNDELIWTPPVPADREPTTHRITVVADDGNGGIDEQEFEITVYYPAIFIEPFPSSRGTQLFGGRTSVGINHLGGDIRTLVANFSVGSGTIGWSSVVGATPDWIAETSGPLIQEREVVDSLNFMCRNNADNTGNIRLRAVWEDSPYGNVRQAVAGPVYDSNQDGVADNADDIYAAIAEVDTINVYNLTTRERGWAAPILGLNTPTIAMANVDADTDVEVLAVVNFPGDFANSITAFDGDGSVLWRSAHDIYGGEYSTRAFEMPILPVDLNNDGTTEILVGPHVYDNNGNLLWQFDITPIGPTRPRYAVPLAIDLDGDGNREVMFQNEVRAADGTLLWTLPYSLDTRRPQVLFAVGDLQGDSTLEVVASIDTGAGVFHHAFAADGTPLWDAIPGVGFGQPVVTDFDRDGDVDIFTPAGRTFITADGEIASFDTGIAYNVNQPIVDLDQDGMPERLSYANSWGFGVSDVYTRTSWSGASFRDQTNAFANTRMWQSAMWIDANHDGGAEIFVTGTFGAGLFESAFDPFPLPTRRASQAIDFDQPVIGFDTEYGRSEWPGVADAWVGRITLTQQTEQSFTLSAQVRNKGMGPVNSPVTVQFFSGRIAEGRLIGEVTLDDLPIATVQTVSLPITDAELDVVMSAQLVLDPGLVECEARDGRVEGEWKQIELRDGDTPYRQARFNYLHQTRYFPRDISFGAVPQNPTIEVGQNYSFFLVAGAPFVEDQIGNSVSYSLNTAATDAGMRYNRLTGEITWTPTFADIGTYNFEAFAASLTDSTRAVFSINVVARANEAPVITTTPASTFLTPDATFIYDVDATDADNDTLLYSLSTAPNGMTIDPFSGVVNWPVAGAAVGLYPVEVTVDDSFGGVVTQSFSLQVGAVNNTGPNITSVPPLSARATFEYQYQVAANDPDGDPLTYTVEAGPAGMTIDNSGLLSWTPAVSGMENVLVRVSDGRAFVEQGWVLQISDASIPLVATVNANPPVAEIGSTVDLTIGYSGAAGPVSLSLTVDGVAVPVDPLTGQATYVTAAVGQRTVTAIVSDPYTSDSATTTFNVIDSSLGSMAPIVTLVTPDFEQEVTAPIDAIGSVDDPDDDLISWFLAIQPRGAEPTEFTILAQDTAEVPNDVLGQIDPTMLLNGLYTVILQASDAGGNVSQDARVIRVTGDLKVGNFSITFEDFSAPVAGIPVTVLRTYDTRRRNEDLDFGYGWTIDYQNVRLQESRDIGFSWSLIEEDLGLFSQFCVRPNGDPTVTVRLPDGEIETFVARAVPECTQLVPTVDVNIVFEPRDFTSTTLEQTDFGTVRIVNGNIVDLGEPDTPIDATNYRLTTEEGVVYDLDQDFGVRRITDTHGNTLTYSDSGIVHSQGFALTFNRNADGRIESIVAPDGTRMAYAYDANGDLESFTDQVDNVTRFTYTNGTDHYLEDIIDPRGIRVSRNEYDDDGRLIAIIDADGNRIEYDHDIVGRTETVRDRRMNPTIYVYDDEGNVLVETNPLGETTTRTYDEDRNVLTETNDLGERMTWTYDERGNVLTETNDLSQTTTNTYDDRNLLETVTDALDLPVMRNVYDTRNTNLLTMTDANDDVTTFFWDAAIGTCSTGASRGTLDAENNRTTIQPQCVGPFAELPAWEEDARGVRTNFEYDALGRLERETTTRTDEFGAVQDLVTLYEYDEKGRLERVTDPENNVTITEWNVFDKEAATIDPNLNRTEYEYDDRGNRRLIRYADLTTETMDYDPEGNMIAQTDRLGRTTRMIYDAANRLRETIYPDDTPGNEADNPRTINEYDRAGRLSATIDERGNRTEYEYDRAGRRELIRTALNEETRFEYDARGLRTAMIDALNRRTEYVYDDAGRLLTTIFPDDTPGDDTDNLRMQVDYDRIGRKVAETDLAGLTTRFEYDEVGNLEAVVDALDQRTEYGYDEQSNKITQTDAERRVTRWAYDNAGRVTSRTLPETQRETFTYDDASNRIGHVDFNAESHSFDYDELNRQIRQTYADGIVVTMAYTDTGQLETVTDDRGATSFDYDERDRLVTITYPTGRTIDYGYDDAGNRTSLDTANQSIAYTFDVLNRLEDVTDEAGTTTYGYDAVGNRASIDYANGTRTTYVYDPLYRLLELSHFDTADVLIDQHTYTLGDNGNRLQHAELSGRVVDYTYDDLYRLETETVTDATLGNRSASWTYDAVGNRETQTETGAAGTTTTTYVYDDNDRLATENAVGVAPSSTSYVYDQNGNTRTRTADGVVTEYAYDSRNRLIDLNNGQVTYRYDATGIRMSETAAGLTTQYLVDPNRDFAQVIEESFDLSTDAEVRYTYGDDLVAQYRRIGPVTTEYRAFHYDGLGSTRLLTDTSGTITDNYTFTAFGELESSSGITANDHLHTGEQYDPNLGFYYLRARYYNPAVGRFQNMDLFPGLETIPSSLNKYAYVANDPILEVDPTGLSNLTELSFASNIRGTIGRAIPTASGKSAAIASRARTIKIYTVFTFVRWQIGPIPFPGIHRFMVAETPFGIFRYDVGALTAKSALSSPLSNVGGRITMSRVSSWAQINQIRFKRMVARHNSRQWLSWSLVNTSFEPTDLEDLLRGSVEFLQGNYQYCFTGPNNCIGWVSKSVISAKVFEKIMK